MVTLSIGENPAKHFHYPKSPERRYQRASCCFPTVIRRHGKKHSAKMTTVALGGCYLSTDIVPEMGEKLDMEIHFDPERASFPCIARVVWTRNQLSPEQKRRHPRGFAVEFFRMDPEHKELIDNYVRRMVRIFRTLAHELEAPQPDTRRIKTLFGEVRPKESTHLSHIRKVVSEEIRHFRLRK